MFLIIESASDDVVDKFGYTEQCVYFGIVNTKNCVNKTGWSELSEYYVESHCNVYYWCSFQMVPKPQNRVFLLFLKLHSQNY